MSDTPKIEWEIGDRYDEAGDGHVFMHFLSGTSEDGREWEGTGSVMYGELVEVDDYEEVICKHCNGSGITESNIDEADKEVFCGCAKGREMRFQDCNDWMGKALSNGKATPNSPHNYRNMPRSITLVTGRIFSARCMKY